MREHPHYQDDAIVNLETHHEKSDVSIRAVIWFIVLVLIFSFVLHIAIWLMFKGLVRVERRAGTGALTAMTRPEDMAVPKNQPLLQPFPRKLDGGAVQTPALDTPVTDLAAMRAAEDRVLHSYGWVDPQKGIVHIPIEEAMKLTLANGLPAAATSTGGPP
jgi:hypothetical protein